METKAYLEWDNTLRRRKEASLSKLMRPTTTSIPLAPSTGNKDNSPSSRPAKRKGTDITSNQPAKAMKTWPLGRFFKKS
ncbi:unnamed protein product [Clonostachys rosea]|uniref:Uncharacterized protein n=1 Tax=Bionectria ochroleuca TaxID=29856 RepID=A0ABY6TRU3_BIOOC|nr:unnamed protein product [Clonostachys rosea]